MSIEGFPSLGKQLKIVNKLNGMCLTLAEGAYNSSKDGIIVQPPLFHNRQTFRITQKGNNRVYFIESAHKDLALSTKSGWGDMLYSEAKVDKYNQDVSQMWRIVPYDEFIYNDSNQQKHVFQQIPFMVNQKASSSCKPCVQISNSLKLGYEYHPHLAQTKSESVQSSLDQQPVTQPVYKLGYEFESGPNVNAYVEVKPQQKVKSELSNNQTADSNFVVPSRFVIKEKNNILPIDKDTKGWFFIENVKYNNLVLQIEGGIDQKGMSIVLNKIYGNRNQLWKFV